ncbi:hypothetical protein ZWY2020_037723 [Hordeum vulgare]|nr:hypothetical protein ZWY2020_037723 [Hordeum vulgare]
MQLQRLLPAEGSPVRPTQVLDVRSHPCGSDVCKTLQSDHFDNGCTMNGTQSQCGYQVEYGGGLKTRGVYSNEALTLAPGVVIEDFHFGCAYTQSS